MIDDYITDVLLRDLVGHDRRPVSFLVYLWLAAEQARRGAAVQISYQELAENIGISKSSVQAAVSWLRRQKLLSASKETPPQSRITPRSLLRKPPLAPNPRARAEGPLRWPVFTTWVWDG